MIKQALHSLSLRNISLRYKLVLSTLIVVCTITFASFAGFFITASKSNEMIYGQTAGSMSMLSDKIASQLEYIMNSSSYLMAERKIQDNLVFLLNPSGDQTGRFTARKSITETLYRFIEHDIISITILPCADSPIIWGQNSAQESAETLEAVTKLAEESKGGIVWYPSGKKDGSLLCVREIRSYREPFLEILGYMVIRTDFSVIVERTADQILKSPEYSMMIHNGQDILYPLKEEGSSALQIPKAPEEGYQITSIDGRSTFVSYSTVATSASQWDMALGVPYDSVLNSVIMAGLTYTIGVLCAVAFSFLVSWLLLRGITRPFQLLVKKMKRVRSGNLELLPSDIPIGNDELGVLNTQFDEMTQDFKKVIEDNYVKELLLTQTKLKSLEQQMNPHFLYNSLETIRWFSKRSGDENVAVIAQSLGSLLRYSLSREEMRIPVKEELEILDSYLKIQKLRFPDTLVTSIQAEPETRNLLVPKMSVQPLVENAIIHSLEENIGVCEIAVCISRQGDTLCVAVTNDGSEIDEDIIQQMKDGTVRAKGNGIGLINIDTRIKLLFGRDYGLQFENGFDTVTVSFSVPAVENETGQETKTC